MPPPPPRPPSPPRVEERWRPSAKADEEEEGELVAEKAALPLPAEEVKAAEPARTAAEDETAVFDDEDEEAQRLREEKELEERRRRRAEILAKHGSDTAHAAPQPTASPPSSATAAAPLASTVTPAAPATPSASLTAAAPSSSPPHTPPADTKASLTIIALQADPSLSPAPTSQLDAPPTRSSPAPPPPPSDDFDMFSDSPSALLLPSSRRTAGPSHSPSATSSSSHPANPALELLDSWDDAEGYYKYRAGDLLVDPSAPHRRYRVVGLQGSGVFSTVLRVREEVVEGSDSGVVEVVVKVIRNNETMYKAGVKEVEFLTRIASSASHSTSRPHVIQLRHHFHHRNHLCLVFPPYAMDLRRVIKKFGSVGLSLPAVRMFAHQLLIALRLLHTANVVHGDIKPDNILVSDTLNDLALCDFGSASMASECEVTPYLVSRFYRAPEVMLGCVYGHGIDLWSVGCVLFELYTGKILFDGKSNNEMLWKVMQLKGSYPARLLKRAQFAAKHFSHTGDFMLEREDVAGKVYRQVMERGGERDLYAVMKGYSGEGEGKDEKSVRRLKALTDLIHQCLVLDPLKRPSVEQLLKHAFIRED